MATILPELPVNARASAMWSKEEMVDPRRHAEGSHFHRPGRLTALGIAAAHLEILRRARIELLGQIGCT